MCGIVGYVGPRSARPILMNGLKRLEYRGYDSAGIALLTGTGLMVSRSVGKIKRLEEVLGDNYNDSTHGIAHTRWATHGEPTEVNAHPHTDNNYEIALVHNGIIENYRALREFLTRKGVTLRTQTDTEVLVHLVAYNYDGDLTEAVRNALTQVEGTYGIAVISARHPNMVVAARMGSPLRRAGTLPVCVVRICPRQTQGLAAAGSSESRWTSICGNGMPIPASSSASLPAFVAASQTVQ